MEIVFILLLSMGVISLQKLPNKVDQKVETYYNTFKEEFSINPYTIPITIELITKKNVGGKCDKYVIPFTDTVIRYAIVINREYWESLKDDYCKEQLIYHELGHCLLQLDHDDSTVWKGSYLVPKSIMHPIHFGCYPFYRDNRDYYINELKHNYLNKDNN